VGGGTVVAAVRSLALTLAAQLGAGIHNRKALAAELYFAR
jgi:hypothetical protein